MDDHQTPGGSEEIERRFAFDPPVGNHAVHFESLRKRAVNVAHWIENLCPDSREKALALTNLEQSIMWAKSSIARRQ